MTRARPLWGFELVLRRVLPSMQRETASAAAFGAPVARGSESRGLWLGSLVLALSALVVGCASVMPEPEPANPWQRAGHRLLDKVLAQGLAERSAAAARDPQRQGLSLKTQIDEPLRKEGSGGPALSTLLAQRIDAKHPAYARSPNGASDPGSATRWELRSTLSQTDPAAGISSPGTYMLAMELYDPVRRRVLAAGTERFADTGLDRLRVAPTPVAPPPAPVVKPAPPPEPVRSPAERLQALNSEYLALLRQGRETDAQAVFGRIVATGLAARSLNMKFLFAPSSTEFVSDPVLVKRYEAWLAELATQMGSSQQCLQVVGFASRSGSAAQNRRISLARAERVRQVMLRFEPSLASRVSAVGLGTEAATASSGSKDQDDATDRRAELKVIDCP